MARPPPSRRREAEPDAPKAYIVGAGRMGLVWARCLPAAGVEVLGVWSRSQSSTARARRALEVPCSFGRLPDRISHADLILISVPDEAIEELCVRLVDEGLIGRGQDVVHCSGCLDLAPLERARTAGALVGSLHPLRSFAKTRRGEDPLHGALAVTDGLPSIRRRLAALARRLGMRPISLGPSSSKSSASRQLYHAAASLAAGGVISVMDLAIESATAAGLGRKEALTALLDLTRSALDNLEGCGETGEALTGPIARGDERIVRMHIEALSRLSPGSEELYRQLSNRARAVARASIRPPDRARRCADSPDAKERDE